MAAMNDARRANEIDLLRFLAALAVVFFHYFHLASSVTGGQRFYPNLAAAARYGYLGVDLFFMISGFVILMSASQGTVRDFLASRAARLLPAFWACCTATFLVLTIVGDWRGLGNYFANMSMVGLLAQIRVMDGSYWSLTYELRFYLLVALVLVVGHIRRAEELLAIWLIVAIALTAHPVRFINSLVMQDYAAYFIGGGMLYFVWVAGLTARRAGVLAGCIGLAEYHALQVAASLQVRDGVPFEPTVVASIVAGCFLVLLAVAMRKTGALARGNWLAVGALTYPLYLLHQTIGIVAVEQASRWVPREVMVWLVIAAMIGAARLVNTRVEANGGRLIRRWLIGPALGRPDVGALSPRA